MDRLRRMPTPLLAVLTASLLANLVLLGLLCSARPSGRTSPAPMPWARRCPS